MLVKIICAKITERSKTDLFTFPKPWRVFLVTSSFHLEFSKKL